MAKCCCAASCTAFNWLSRHVSCSPWALRGSATSRVDETSVLGDVLAAHLAKGAAESSQLQPYRAAGVQKLHILMLRAHSPVRCRCHLEPGGFNDWSLVQTQPCERVAMVKRPAVVRDAVIQ